MTLIATGTTAKRRTVVMTTSRLRLTIAGSAFRTMSPRCSEAHSKNCRGAASSSVSDPAWKSSPTPEEIVPHHRLHAAVNMRALDARGLYTCSRCWMMYGSSVNLQHDDGHGVADVLGDEAAPGHRT